MPLMYDAIKNRKTQLHWTTELYDAFISTKNALTKITDTDT